MAATELLGFIIMSFGMDGQQSSHSDATLAMGLELSSVQTAETRIEMQCFYLALSQLLTNTL